MLMTHGFGDAENKLTGRLDPLHPAFSGRFAAYSGILGRSSVEDRVARQDRPIGWPEVLPASAIRPQIVPHERATGDTWPTAYRLPTHSRLLGISGLRARPRPSTTAT